jgi:sugar phosphate isomerase/epimerase
MIRYTHEDIALLQRLGLTTCQLIIWPGDPLSPTDGSGPTQWHDARLHLDTLGITVNAIGAHLNHLDPDPALAARNQAHLASLIQAAPILGCDVIGTFAGRDPELPIEQNIPAFRAAFTPLCQQAEDTGIRLAIENCPMFLGWPFRGINFAHTPAAWDLMFDAVTSPALGLEYDPSHLICQLIDPVSVIRRYGSKIFHAHAKDAEIEPHALQQYGILDRRTTRHRMPGLGQADWPSIIYELQRTGYTGNLDIEGRHDPEYTGNREEEGLRIAVQALQRAISVT